MRKPIATWARCWNARTEYEEAIQHYRAAIEAKPNFRAAHFQLGRLLLMKNRTSEAIAQLSQTLTPEDGETPRFMYALGVAYVQAGDSANGARYLREAGQRAASLGQEQLAEQIEAALRRVDEQGQEIEGSRPRYACAFLAGCARQPRCTNRAQGSAKRPTNRDCDFSISPAPPASSTCPRSWAPASLSSTTTAMETWMFFSCRAPFWSRARRLSDARFPPPAGWKPGNRLFRNMLKETGKLQFVDVTEQAGLSRVALRHGSGSRRLQQRWLSGPLCDQLRREYSVSKQWERERSPM